LLSNPKRLLGIILANFILVASVSAGLYKPAKKDVTPGASLAELKKGRQLYISNCASCHSLYEPERYDTARWRRIMDRMAPKSHLNDENKALIWKYVTKGAK
jgi:Cytochrome c1